MWSDDGIIIRLPEAVDELDVDDLLPDPDEVAEHVVSRACPARRCSRARFRECSARALLLPRRRVDRRTPLWQQRQRAGRPAGGRGEVPRRSRCCWRRPASASTTCSTCPSLVDVLAGVREPADPTVVGRHPDRVADGASRCCSAGSRSTCTRATRRWPSAGPPRWRSTATCCATCSATTSCDRWSTPTCSIAVEAELQRLDRGSTAPATSTRSHDLLRVLGPLTLDELAERTEPTSWPTAPTASTSRRGRRAGRGAARHRRCRSRASDALRRRRRRGPTRATRSASRIPLGLPAGVHRPGRRRRCATSSSGTPAPTVRSPRPRSAARLGRRRRGGPARAGRARGGSTGWCRASSVRWAPTASGATPTCLRSHPTPHAGRAAPRGRAGRGRGARPVPADVAGRRLGPRGARRARSTRSPQLQGAPLVASTLEVDVLPPRLRRVPPRRPRRAVHVGRASCGSAPAASAPTTAGCACASASRPAWSSPPPDDPPDDPHHDALLAHLAERGASFWPDLRRRGRPAAELPYDEAVVLAALWDLVWAGAVTNDSLGPAPGAGRLAGTARRSGGGADGRGRTGPAAARRPRPVAGRWSRRCSRPEPSPTEVAHARAIAAARPLRRADPRDGAGRGRRRPGSPACTRC